MLKNNNDNLIPLDLCFQLLSQQIQTYSKRKNKITICFIRGSCVRTSVAVLHTAGSSKASGISRLHIQMRIKISINILLLACRALTQPLTNNDFNYTHI